MKVKGKKIISKSGEALGEILGSRHPGYKDSGYWIRLEDGRMFGFILRPSVGYKCGAFAYFQDAAKYVREGGLERDMGKGEQA